MSAHSGEENWLQLGVAADLAKHYNADANEFLELLAKLLEDALPETTEIERAGGWLARVKPVRRLEVELDEWQYALERQGSSPLRASRTRLVRGVALKTQTLSVAQWIEALGEALEARAQSSEEARDALEKLLK